MVSIMLFFLSWLVFLWFGDKKRIPELFPTSVFAAFLGLLTDLIMEEYQLWSYHDSPLSGQGVPLVLDFGIYPVVAYLYMQYLPQRTKKRVIYILYWTIGSILLEYAYLKFGLIRHHLWWSLWISYISDWMIYGLFILQYQYYAKADIRL